MLGAILLPVLSWYFLPEHALPRGLSAFQRSASPHKLQAREQHSLNVSSCPGYTLTGLIESSTGLTAKLALAGPECNAFGTDIEDLTIQVTYESQSRLHVNIFDTAQTQFTVPKSIVRPPAPPTDAFTSTADLAFNYDASPFAFWITRRSDPGAAPLFDTRPASLPAAPTAPVIPGDASTALDGFPLVFEDQYLQLTSALPRDANVYGLGEVVASAGFRRDVANGTIQTMWARDAGNPVDQNEYGVHPFFVEHRLGAARGAGARAHGVFLNSAAGADVLLLAPPGADAALVQYRMLGGTLDLYFFAGPGPMEVVEQYAEVVGTPAWQPLWGFGFHLCRWGYGTVNETREAVRRMREADIPLEVQWNDIDLYHAYRDFTSDPVSFPADEMRAFIGELHANHQRYIPILDAAIPKPVNDSDVYDPYTKGAALGVFLKNPDGSEHVGQVWPGYTVFPDWLAPRTGAWWTEAVRNWSAAGVAFDGIWLDMNEASSFCDGSCGTGADLSNTSTPFILPGQPGNLITDYPECYDEAIFGPSGNITVNGTLTCNATWLSKRGLGALAPASSDAVDLNAPPYAIHNGAGHLSANTIATNATHAGGRAELDVHNLWGTMEEKATRDTLLELKPGERPFVVSRGTFAGAGKFTSHWLGDNFSKWYSMRSMIQGVLQFQLFHIPMVGADTCGFIGNSDEELCNRWMQAAAFTPFFRNHNILGAISQEPYVWDSVAAASRTAIHERYRLLPYWYSLFANASMRGTPPVRALWFEFPDDGALLGVDTQFLIGRDVLVTPVLYPDHTSVTGHFPGAAAGVVWRDWFTHAALTPAADGTATLPAPLGTINVHLRDGSALLLHREPGYTTHETAQGPYELLVSLDKDGAAWGQAYVDDFISEPPTASRTVDFVVGKGALMVSSAGSYVVGPKVERVTLLGVGTKPRGVKVGGKKVKFMFDEKVQKVVLHGVSVDLNVKTTVTWW